MNRAALSISIVDDDASVLRAVRRLLRAVGFSVETFGSAEEFLAARDRVHTDCLVLDVHLGGVSGFDLQARLLASGSSLPIVLVTAHDDPATRERTRRAGVEEYLRKPFDDSSLVEAIHRAIDRGVPRAPDAG